MNKKELIEISKVLYCNLEANIHQINSLYDATNEAHKFYYGITTRQLYFVSDISCLLSHQYVNNLTSIFIIARTVLDDFIPLHYISIQSNPEDQITLLNAYAHEMNFKKIRDLAEINDNLLEGAFPYYPTKESVNDMKTQLLDNPDKAKYISNRTDFKFHKFLTKRQLIDKYEGKDSRADLYRCYFQWRSLSDYVHYSKFSYELDSENQTPTIEYDIIFEVFLYAYFGCKVAIDQMSNYINVEHIPEKYFEEADVKYLSSINN